MDPPIRVQPQSLWRVQGSHQDVGHGQQNCVCMYDLPGATDTDVAELLHSIGVYPGHVAFSITAVHACPQCVRLHVWKQSHKKEVFVCMCQRTSARTTSHFSFFPKQLLSIQPHNLPAGLPAPWSDGIANYSPSLISGAP
jgi:hypothetical protein